MQRREAEEADRLCSGLCERGVRHPGRGKLDVRRSGKTILLAYERQVR